MWKHLGRLACAVLMVVAGFGVAAAAFPEKPINLIVPYGAGGSTDVMARAIGISTRERA